MSLIYHNQSLDSLSFLVTGGAGFIGSNIVEYLLANGAKKVRVLDDLSTGFAQNIAPFTQNERFEFINGSIADAALAQKACEKIDIVLHQAALGSVPRSMKEPLVTNHANVSGFLSMLWAAKTNGVRRFVYASSSSVYGDNPVMPKVEERTGQVLSPYALTKSINEQYADVFARCYGLEVIGLRYFNIFGPNQSPQGAYAAVIPLFINALLNDQAPRINGDGSQSRDFTFVQNAVQANIRAALVQDSLSLNQAYNIGCGGRYDLCTLVSHLNELLGKNIAPIHQAPRDGDIPHSQASIEKAQRLLGYEPAYDFKAGLKLTVEWFKAKQLIV